ncbi:MAG: LacI family transcriptional regulator [Verrucomicrobia bacterium Tous-C9LFEB]|nr:MAG: LacI family transcriptional regulator [Verrucomicrobia bacterium Tous-C9LFEB]
MNRPTLKDIAAELGVTTMTVSKSLRGIGRISEETRRLVRRKAEEIGYFSSKDRLFPPFVKAFSGSENKLSLLCPTVGSLDRGDVVPYRNDMMIGLNRSLAKMEGTAVAESFASLDEMLAFLNKEHFHGVALSEPYPTRWLNAMRKSAPVIYTIGHDFQTGVDSVYFNEARAAALAVNKLRAAGHRNIAWLGILDRHAPFLLPDEEFSDEDTADWLSHSGHGVRYASWLYLANQHPDLANWPVCLIERDWTTTSLSEAVRQGCRKILETRPQPTAIVCSSNPVARELITQLEETGLHIPKDISIVSYGVEEEGLTQDGHTLSGLVMPMDKVGGLVPEVVQRRIAYPEGLPISIQLDATWNPGETVRPLTL